MYIEFSLSPAKKSYMKNKKISTKEIDNSTFVDVLEKYKAKVSKTEESSRKFLIELGVITEKGNLKKNYKNLCIPAGQE